MRFRKESDAAGVTLFYEVAYPPLSLENKSDKLNAAAGGGLWGEAPGPSGLGSQPLDLAHGILAADDNVVGIVHDAVADRVG